ncbi:hypothetical protein ACH4TV_19735 [Streptomyces sp. NPDC020898]|uniref:hypothetical protein n=1 Tax=Streptomyces sp. NPDC020898 TaxID=3365101 RepID=UPI0037AF2E45
MTTPTYAASAHPRQFSASGPAESVPQGHPQSRPNPPAPPPPPDPPIYRALLRTWSDRGRTLPGRYDPEWDRLAAPPVGLGIVVDPFNASPVPPGDGR